MKTFGPYIIISALTLVLGIVITLTVQQMFFKPDPPNVEMLKWKLEQLDKKDQEQDQVINRVNLRRNDRDNRLTQDSLNIMFSDRHYRDSIRDILNPPE